MYVMETQIRYEDLTAAVSVALALGRAQRLSAKRQARPAEGLATRSSRQQRSICGCRHHTATRRRQRSTVGPPFGFVCWVLIELR